MVIQVLGCTKDVSDECLSRLLQKSNMKAYQGETLYTDCKSLMALSRWQNMNYYKVHLPCADYWPPILLTCEEHPISWTDEKYGNYTREVEILRIVGIEQ